MTTLGATVTCVWVADDVFIYSPTLTFWITWCATVENGQTMHCMISYSLVLSLTSIFTHPFLWW